MNPSSLLNVSPDLMRERAHHGRPDAPMAAADDRSWSLKVCVALAAFAGLLVLINLATNPNRIWFHWPVMALLFAVIMRAVLRRGRRWDKKDDR